MAVLDGLLTQTAEPGPTNTRLSLGLHDFAYLDFPRRDSIVGTAERTAFAYADNKPVTQVPRVKPGVFPVSYYDDFYNRVHINPALTDLGNVASVQQFPVDIWNAWVNSIILTGQSASGPGIDVIGPDGYPITLDGGGWLSWLVGVTPQGEPTIDVSITWTIQGLPAVTTQVVANRVVAWAFTPDWKRGIRERIEWLTDVLPSATGAEQRRAMRIAPRRMLKAEVLIEGRERRQLDNILHAWGARIFGVPIWWDIQLLETGVAAGSTAIPCIPEYRDFRVDGLALLRGENADLFEVVSITSVGASSIGLSRGLLGTWPAGTRLYPVRLARLKKQPRIRRFHDNAWRVNVEFKIIEPNDWTAATFAKTYRNHPVYEVAPDETEELDLTFESITSEWDNEVSEPYLIDTAEAAFALQSHRWVMHGGVERDTLRRLIYALRGRQVSVWVPTHASDFELTANVDVADTLIDVESTGYSRFGIGRLGRRDIRIELTDGTALFRRIVSVNEIDADTERLTIDSNLGRTVTPAQVQRISFMRLMRLNDDDIEIIHETDLAGVATAEATFRVIRDDL